MKENKMKTLKKVIIPVMMLCLIPACPNDVTWVTTDVLSTSDTLDTFTSDNSISSSGESASSTSLVTESSTTLIEDSTSSGMGNSTTLDESSTSETGDIIPVCGNSIVEPPEECDDGIPGTGTAFCTYNCTISFCGDGIINFLDNEQCDDGNMNDLDSCNLKCQLPRN